MLRELGADAARGPQARRRLEGLDGLVIPGGESTTIVKGIESAGLEDRRSAPTTRPGGRSSAPAPG